MHIRMCKGQGAKEYVFLRCCHIMSHIIGTRIRQRKLQKANLKNNNFVLQHFNLRYLVLQTLASDCSDTQASAVFKLGSNMCMEQEIWKIRMGLDK